MCNAFMLQNMTKCHNILYNSKMKALPTIKLNLKEGIDMEGERDRGNCREQNTEIMVFQQLIHDEESGFIIDVQQARRLFWKIIQQLKRKHRH